MVSGLQFVESILFWVGFTMLFSAFISACMESRHSGEIDYARSWLASWFEQIGLVPITLILVATLRMIRDAADHIISELITDFDLSSVSAPIVMAILSIFLPVAAGVNALLGGSILLLMLYASVVLVCLILGFGQTVRGAAIGTGLISAMATFQWLVFGPFYAAFSLTDHILTGTFSHSVLGSLLVSAVLYAGCAGTWLFYRGIKNVQTLSSVDRAFSRFLFAIPFFYILYWLGLLAGHFAINEVSPTRGWGDIASVVVIGAVSFVAIMSTIEFGVSEQRRSHGFAVLLAAGIVSLIGVIAINGLVLNGPPFWLRLWHHDFNIHEIDLGSRFWSTHAPFLLWITIISSILFIGIARFVITAWPGGMVDIKDRPFLGLCAINTVGASIVFAGMSLIDVYVNVN